MVFQVFSSGYSNPDCDHFVQLGCSNVHDQVQVSITDAIVVIWFSINDQRLVCMRAHS
jgi:hypothetical protein